MSNTTQQLPLVYFARHAKTAWTISGRHTGLTLHVPATVWLGLEPAAGRCFFGGTGALSILGYHHDRDDPVIRLWNDCSHEGD